MWMSNYLQYTSHYAASGARSVLLLYVVCYPSNHGEVTSAFIKMRPTLVEALMLYLHALVAAQTLAVAVAAAGILAYLHKRFRVSQPPACEQNCRSLTRTVLINIRAPKAPNTLARITQTTVTLLSIEVEFSH